MVLLQYYSVLQTYYSSTTPYCKVLLQYYSLLQSTTLYYKVLLRPKRRQNDVHPVLLCTTKYYSSTTLYYKVLARYYSVLQSTSQAPAAAPAPAAAAPPPLAPATPASAQHQRQHQRQHQHQHQRQRQHQQHQDEHQHQQHQRHHQQRAAPAPAESQFYYSFGRLTRTILRKGSSSTGRIAILPQFRALDTHDLTKGSHSARQDRNFTTVSGDQHARSYERVHRAAARSQFYYSFGRSTRTILRKGSSGSRKIAILLQFRAINTHDLTKGFIGQPQDRNFTTVSGDRHARSYERVANPQAFSGPWRPPPSLLN